MYEQQIPISQAAPLLTECGLSVPDGVDYTVGIFDEANRLLAVGSLKESVLQGIAVSPAHQGEDLSAKVLTHLLKQGAAMGHSVLRLFTKPERAFQFSALGFHMVAMVPPYAALLEWGRPGIEEYAARLRKLRLESGPDSVQTAVLVMNCNPFTLGHQQLIAQAAKENDLVYVLMVEEDVSQFSFIDRFRLVKQGCRTFDNVQVLPGGPYVVSALTFPSYFTKEAEHADAHAAIDLEIFCRHIAPALGATRRYAGTEPLSPVTALYNAAMKRRLPKAGIEVIEVPRFAQNGQVISASLVRDLWNSPRPIEEKLDTLKDLVPACTLQFLRKLQSTPF